MSAKQWHKDELSRITAERLGENTYGLTPTEVDDALPQDIKDQIGNYVDKYDDFIEHWKENESKCATDSFPIEKNERLRKEKDDAFERLEEKIKSKIKSI